MTGYAKNRRKFRCKTKRYRAKKKGEDPDIAMPKRSPGHRPKEPGMSHHDKSEYDQKSFVADMCTQYG